MTPQSCDTILIDGKQYCLYSCPLNNYWTEKNPKPQIRIPITSNYRGYVAKWEIVDGFLYITDLLFRGIGNDYDLEYIFPGAVDKVKATWYTGELKIPLGDPLIPLGCTRYDYFQIPTETTWFIQIEQGEVITRWYKANY
jgi:hypothetical protein